MLDLYAGVGLFALALSGRADAVLGAELNPVAVEDARANIEANRKTNVRVRQGDVTESLASWPAAPGEPIVLDPPRTGAGAPVVRAVAARRPACVVYVSCDPPTLGRDLAVFAKQGYAPDAIRAFDLFPDTFHLETVVRLIPRSQRLRNSSRETRVDAVCDTSPSARAARATGTAPSSLRRCRSPFPKPDRGPRGHFSRWPRRSRRAPWSAR